MWFAGLRQPLVPCPNKLRTWKSNVSEQFWQILLPLIFKEPPDESGSSSVAHVRRVCKINSNGSRAEYHTKLDLANKETLYPNHGTPASDSRIIGKMYCPKCGSQNGDDVLYCRGCGVDLGAVRGSLVKAAGHDLSAHFSDRQLRRMQARGIDENVTPLALESRAIDLRSGGVRSLIVAAGFAFVTAIIYSRPPVDGIFWLFWLVPTFIFFATSLSRFVQAGMIKKLLRATPRQAALPEAQPDYIQPRRSIYETDELAQPRSVTDATTRHLR